MKKRKILAMLMVAALSAGMLAGCGSDNTKEESKSTEAADTKESTEENKDTEETKEESTDDSADQSEGTEEEVSGFTDGSGDGEGTDETADDTSTVLDTSEPLTGLHHAEIEVKDYGTIKVELDADTAPISVTNFVKLAQEHFYDGLTFHRIIDGFMIQGGDPEGTGIGGPGYSIHGEFSNNGFTNNLKHTPGVLSMARTMMPNSAGSQFFIMHAAAPHLDGEYAGFGKVIEGMENVNKIAEVRCDYSDRPMAQQKMAKVTVETFGVDYPEPEKC